MFKFMVFLTSLCVLALFGTVWMEQVKDTSDSRTVQEEALSKVEEIKERAIPVVKDIMQRTVGSLEGAGEVSNSENSLEEDESHETYTEVSDDEDSGNGSVDQNIQTLNNDYDKWNTIKETEETLMSISTMLREKN